MSRNYNFTPFSYGASSNKPAPQKSMNYGAVPPPPVLQTTSRPTGIKAKASYTSMDAISQYVIPPQNYGSKKRSAQQTDDDYFDDDETAEENLAYIPAEGSPAQQPQEDSDEEDPLDAFMKGLEKAESTTKPAPQASTSVAPAPSSKGVRADIDDMDDEESYYKYLEDNPMAGMLDDEVCDFFEGLLSMNLMSDVQAACRAFE